MKKSILAAVTAVALLSGCGVAAAIPQATSQSVPQACLDALDDADHLIGVNVELIDIMVDILDAVTVMDVRGVDRSSDIDALTRQVERSTYAKNRDACKAGAR